MKTILIAFAAALWAAIPINASSSDAWSAAAPRDEIRPQFQQTTSGGKSNHGALIIRADEREGLHGWWHKTFPVSPGQHYRFSAWRRTENVPVPRRTGLARVIWRNEAGKDVKRPEGVVTNYSIGVVASAEPEYPRDITESSGSDGWVEVSGTYQAPSGATQARVELHALWAPNSKIEWSDI